ncbi:hypothetical protein PsorP6_000614 [Peronosclerospora sorghi]|uniref:Uncharacterized protein n=1 Tax=Peronosclerospora sorghi TaxID=230839 RepID=A0ACC0WRJ8_9STRA|nr:hypothetical protein PsorP6_000614 [Peronosclerospora sorghi]
MKAFTTWRAGDGGGKGTTDAVSELQQIILKKDLMILSLQRQLEAYATHFGALPADLVDELEHADPIPESSEPRSRELGKEFSVDTKQAHTSHPKSPSSAGQPRVRPRLDVEETQHVASWASPNVVLDFVADSPMFRRQVDELDDSTTGLRSLLKEVIIRAKDYAAAGKHFGEQETAFADELIQRKHARAIFSTSCPALGSLAELFNEMHDTLAQIQSSRVSMLLGIESLLSRFIQHFADKELLKEVGELRKEVTRLGDEYETLLGKLLSKPRQPGGVATGTGTPTNSSDFINMLGLASPAVASGSANTTAENATTGQSATVAASHSSSPHFFTVDSGPGLYGPDKNQRALERDVLLARKRFELARFDLVRYLNRIHSMKKVVLVECFNSMLYAQLTHFHACHELVKSVEPSLRKRQEMMQVSRQELETEEATWTAQRQVLEERLQHELERRSASESSPRTVDASPGMDAFPSLELPVEVISFDTSSSRATVATCASASVVKQGYLFVRHALFPARNWKRRWFEIHTRKLFQATGRATGGKHAPELTLTLVCDLLLARVREVDAASLPFCFEVIDASQTKLVLQATSARDRLEWIHAARRSTENALEKQQHRHDVHPAQAAVIDALVRANPCCADCGTEPADWVSINIGCFLCIECSGMHRSLGVHESKIRSLALDSWDMPLLTLLREALGNPVVNGVWEHTLPDGWTKPCPTATRDVKARYITAKYHVHAFVEPVAPGLDVATRFLAAAASGTVQDLMWSIAHGVDVNVRGGDAHETALHVCAGRGASHCCEYLVLNGASVTVADREGRVPSDAAQRGDFEALHRMLMPRTSGEKEDPVKMHQDLS